MKTPLSPDGYFNSQTRTLRISGLKSWPGAVGIPLNHSAYTHFPQSAVYPLQRLSFFRLVFWCNWPKDLVDFCTPNHPSSFLQDNWQLDIP